MEVFETPGHDKSCLTYKVENNVFSGDSYIPGVKVIASFPNSDREDARISKERIPVMETFMSKLFRYLERIYKAVSFLFIPHYVRNPKFDH